MPFPFSLSNLVSTLSGGQLQLNVHAQHHDALAVAVNTIEAAFEAGGVLHNVIYNVKVEGAAGDNFASDDTAAIAAAYAKAAAAAAVGAGATLYFPPGNYRCGPLSVNQANVRIFLEMGATIKQKDAQNSYVVRLNAARCMVDGGGVIDGNHATNNGDGATYPGVQVDADDCTVQGVTIQNVKRGIQHYNGARARFRNLTFRNTVRNAIFSGGGAAAFDDEVWENITVLNHGVGATANETNVLGCPALRLHAQGGLVYHSARMSNLRVEMNAANTNIGVECWADQNGSGAIWKGIVMDNVTTRDTKFGISIDSCDAVVNNVQVEGGIYGLEIAGPARVAVDNYDIDMQDRVESYGIISSNTGNSKVSIGRGHIKRATYVVALGQTTYAEVGPGLIGEVSTVNPNTGIYLTGVSKAIAKGNILIGPGSGSGSVMQIEGPGVSVTVSDNIFDGFNRPVFAWGSSGTFDNIDVHDNQLINMGGAATYPLTNGFTGTAAWGPSVRAHNNSGYHDCVDLLNNILRAKGSGSPEGAVVGGKGSLYQRLDGGAATSLYTKESGVGNTGWVGK